MNRETSPTDRDKTDSGAKTEINTNNNGGSTSLPNSQSVSGRAQPELDEASPQRSNFFNEALINNGLNSQTVGQNVHPGQQPSQNLIQPRQQSLNPLVSPNVNTAVRKPGKKFPWKRVLTAAIPVAIVIVGLISANAFYQQPDKVFSDAAYNFLSQKKYNIDFDASSIERNSSKYNGNVSFDRNKKLMRYQISGTPYSLSNYYDIGRVNVIVDAGDSPAIYANYDPSGHYKRLIKRSGININKNYWLKVDKTVFQNIYAVEHESLYTSRQYYTNSNSTDSSNTTSTDNSSSSNTSDKLSNRNSTNNMTKAGNTSIKDLLKNVKLPILHKNPLTAGITASRNKCATFKDPNCLPSRSSESTDEKSAEIWRQTADSLQCVTKAQNDMSASRSQKKEIVDAIVDSGYVTVTKSKQKTKISELAYDITLNGAKESVENSALEKTTYRKAIKKCADAAPYFSDDLDDNSTSSSRESGTLTLIVDRWSHKPISLTGELIISGTTGTSTIDISLDNKSADPEIELPTNPIEPTRTQLRRAKIKLEDLSLSDYDDDRETINKSKSLLD